MKYDRFIRQLQGTARCLTYNESKAEAEAKHLLLEAAHRIDRWQHHPFKFAFSVWWQHIKNRRAIKRLMGMTQS